MSITPVMQSSALEMIRYENSDKFSNKQRQQGFSRQGSFGNSSSQQQKDQLDRKNSSLSQSSTKKKITKQKSTITKIVQNIYFQIFITSLTIITLYLYDIKTITGNKQEDFTYGIANCIFFAIFMVEIVMNCKTEGYFGSFFFFLDLISTVTILFDVDFIIDSLFNQSSNNFKVSSFVAKSKASRVAARAVRVVKIFRLARVAKLYKSAQKAKQLNQKNKLAILQKQNNRLNHNMNNQNENSAYVNDEMSVYNIMSKSHITKKNINNTCSNLQRYEMQNDSIKQQKDDDDISEKNEIRLNERQRITKKLSKKSSSYEQPQQVQEQQNKQSQISRILSQDTIKKIIIIILLIMTSIPLLDINNYQNVSTQWDLFTNFIGRALINNNISIENIQTLINKQIVQFDSTDSYSNVICYDSPFNEISSCTNIDFDTFRSADLGIFLVTLDTDQIAQIRTNLTKQSSTSSKNAVDSFSIFIDYSEYNRIDAGFSIATTTFICLTIIYLLSSFSKSINELIIVPIEYMLNLIRVKDFKQQQKQQDEESTQQYETELVQNAIIKIKSLMQTIYGPLGNDLVQEKMMNNNSISENLNNSFKKSFCVVALCRINQMCKITEVLGEQAFGLINQVALIVQNAVFRYGGYCTKICDEGFMVVFKVPDQNLKVYQIEEDIDPVFMAKNYQKKMAQTYINTFSDFSVYSALKTLARIVKQPKIFKYRNDQRLLMAFGGLFNIELNFALNMGWCYQVVIGSSHKIDSLVIGEQVNYLDKLMKISRNYSTSILMTESLYSNLSVGLKQHCRPFDSIKFSDSEEPKKLYYVDYDICNVTPSVNKNQKGKKDIRDLKTKKQMNMLYLSGLLPQQQGYNATIFIDSKKELREILKKSSMDGILRKKYKLSFEKYLNGEWAQCQELFQTQYLKNDLPSQRLLNFLIKNNYKSPSDWKGYRNYNSLFDLNK